MIFYSHNLTITIADSGRHLRGEWAFIALRVAHCTPVSAPALDSSGPCSRTCTMHHVSSFSSTTRKPVSRLHDVGCSASERSCESMGERQGRTWTSSVEPKCVVPALGLALVLVLGGTRRLRSQIRLRPHDARGPRRREGEGKTRGEFGRCC